MKDRTVCTEPWPRANTHWMHHAQEGALCHYLADAAIAAAKAGNPDSLVAVNPGVRLQALTRLTHRNGAR